MRQPRASPWPLLALLLFFMHLGSSAEGQTEVFGQPLDFQAVALDGSIVEGRDLAVPGKALLLDFWGTWCPPCIHAFPKLARVRQEFGDHVEVVGVAFDSGSPEKVAAFLESYDVEHSSVIGDEALLDKYTVYAFPSYYLISAEGDVLFSQTGEYPDIYERIAEWFEGR